MKADVIHVMHQGQIVESGSHEELLACGGRYAQSWRSQMQAGFDAPEEVFQSEVQQSRVGGDGHKQRVTVPAQSLVEKVNA